MGAPRLPERQVRLDRRTGGRLSVVGAEKVHCRFDEPGTTVEDTAASQGFHGDHEVLCPRDVERREIDGIFATAVKERAAHRHWLKCSEDASVEGVGDANLQLTVAAGRQGHVVGQLLPLRKLGRPAAAHDAKAAAAGTGEGGDCDPLPARIGIKVGQACVDRRAAAAAAPRR